MAYVFDGFALPSKSVDSAVALAKEITKQSKQETKRVQSIQKISSDAIAANKEVTLAAINLIAKALDDKSAKDSHTIETLTGGLNELNAHMGRMDLCAPHVDELKKINPDLQKKLFKQTRGQVVEIGRPTIRSATGLHIYANDNPAPIGYFNERIVSSLEGIEVDKTPTQFTGSVKSFDKETGWGKIRVEGEARPFSFVVRSDRKTDQMFDIIDSMKDYEVTALFYPARDKGGNIRHLVFLSFMEG